MKLKIDSFAGPKFGFSRARVAISLNNRFAITVENEIALWELLPSLTLEQVSVTLLLDDLSKAGEDISSVVKDEGFADIIKSFTEEQKQRIMKMYKLSKNTFE